MVGKSKRPHSYEYSPQGPRLCMSLTHRAFPEKFRNPLSCRDSSNASGLSYENAGMGILKKKKERNDGCLPDTSTA